jgi:hypothetical protein
VLSTGYPPLDISFAAQVAELRPKYFIQVGPFAAGPSALNTSMTTAQLVTEKPARLQPQAIRAHHAGLTPFAPLESKERRAKRW